MKRVVRTLARGGAILLLVGCSGLQVRNAAVNARLAMRSGDALTRRGFPDSAALHYARAAGAAGRVLAREDLNRSDKIAWNLLASRASALSGDCKTGEWHLRGLMDSPALPPDDAIESLLALASCALSHDQPPHADTLVATIERLTGHTESPQRRARVARWRALVALARDDMAAAEAALAEAGPPPRAWEADAALQRRIDQERAALGFATRVYTAADTGLIAALLLEVGADTSRMDRIRRLRDGLELMRILAEADDSSGAAHLIAARVAHEQLGNPVVAADVVHALLRHLPDAPVLRTALVEAMALPAPFAAAFRDTLLARFPNAHGLARVSGAWRVNAFSGDSQTQALREGRLAIAQRELEARRAQRVDSVRAANTPPT